MNKALLAELMPIAPAERIELVHDLWDSITPGECPSLKAELLILTAEERIELAHEPLDALHLRICLRSLRNRCRTLSAACQA